MSRPAICEEGKVATNLIWVKLRGFGWVQYNNRIMQLHVIGDLGR